MKPIAAPPGTIPTISLGGSTPVAATPGLVLTGQAPAVDVCFVFDTTGSMSDKIDALQGCLTGLVDELHRLDLDWRISTVPFGDLTVGERVVTSEPFCDTVPQARQQVLSMPRFDGGANLGESAADAVLGALTKPYRSHALIVLVLITDEPAHLEHGGPGPASIVTTALANGNVMCFVASPDTAYYRTWATATGGTWTAIGRSPDLSHLRATFGNLVKKVAAISSDVHRIAGGSVRTYLALSTTGGPR